MENLLTNFDADTAELATWNRPRSSAELRSFVNTRHALLPDGISVE